MYGVGLQGYIDLSHIVQVELRGAKVKEGRKRKCEVPHLECCGWSGCSAKHADEGQAFSS